MELCLVDYNMLQFVPSRIAAAALYISQKLNKCGEWVKPALVINHYCKFVIWCCFNVENTCSIGSGTRRGHGPPEITTDHIKCVVKAAGR